MKINSLYSIIAIAAILSLSFCKDDKDDPGPIPPPDNGGDTMTPPPDNGGDPIPMPPMEQDPAGITYSQQDDSPLSDTITLTEEDSNSNMVEYTIVLNSQPTANVEIEITLPSNAPSNLSIASGSQDESGADSSITLTFATDTWDTPQTVTLTLTDDTMSSSINGSLTHIVTSGDPDYNNKDTLNRTIELKLRDTEAGVLYQKNNASLPETIELTEGTDSQYSYMIVLAKQPIHDVTININLNNSPDDLRIDEGGTSVTFTSITFSVDEWDMPQTINLVFMDNDILSGPIMSTLTHITSSTDTSYENLPNKNLMISLIDDEVPPCAQPGAVAENDFTPDIDGENYGAGTENDPYIICNGLQLQAMGSSDSHLGAHYILGKDINASSISTDTCPAGNTGTCTGFQPIGDCGVDDICDNADDMPFTGTLDGKGFTISDLRININLTSGVSYAGLFGYTSGVNIRNIGLLNVDISSSSSGFSSSAGGLVGENNNSSSITNSYSTGNVSSSSSTFASHAGGLVGLNNNSSSITNSYSTGNVSSSASFLISNAGGLVGLNNNSSSITNSYSTGNVSSSASFSFAGGLVGQNNTGSSITNSYSTGNVSSSSAGTSNAGGLLGQNNTGSSITNSYYDRITSTLFENGSEVSDTAVGNNSAILTCVGGFSTSEFIAPIAPNTGSCVPLAIFFDWHEDMNSNRYDSNGDGMIDSSDDFVWNFGTMSEYPFIASTPGTVDEQAVRMASGFLRFSNTILGTPSATDFVFFYDIDDAAMDITTSGTGVQGTAAGSYVIEDAIDASGVALATPPTVTNAGVINGVNSLTANSEFYLKVTFTRGASPDTASYTRRYRFKK